VCVFVCVYGIYEIPFRSVGGKVGGRLGCLCVCVCVCVRERESCLARLLHTGLQSVRIYIRHHKVEYTTLSDALHILLLAENKMSQ